MLNYHWGIKTLFLDINANVFIRSGEESHLRGRVNLENSWRVTVYKVRFTKLTLHAHLLQNINSITRNGLFRSWLLTRIYQESLVIDLEPCYQQCYVKQRPKYINDGILGTMGYPKGRKPYGGGDSVRESGFMRFSSVASFSAYACVGVKGLMKINKKNKKHINSKLIHLVSDIEVLVLAYEIIKSKPRNCTSYADSTVLDNIDLKWFSTISKGLSAGKFDFKPARRVFTLKLGEKSKSTLTITTPRDELVQQVLYLTLNAIYEPSFLNSSHGSRYNRSIHTALKAIKFKFIGVKWSIEAVIDSNRSNINYKILLKLLSKRIVCSKFLALIKKCIKAGYMEDKKFFASIKGLSQTNATNLILNNVYLHELDLFMAVLCESWGVIKFRRKSSIFRFIQYRMEKADEDPFLLRKLRRELWGVGSKEPFDHNSKKLCYTRYADAFIVGAMGFRGDATEIQKKIDAFLVDELKLILIPETPFMTHFSETPTTFLGILIEGS